MKPNKIKIVSIIMLVLLSMPALAADKALGAVNADFYGVLTLIPPLVAIALAFLTKNVMLSLFSGVFAGCFMMEFRTGSFIASLWTGFLRITTEVIGELSDSWNAGIILQVLMIGSLISLITKLGGIKAIADGMTKFAKTARSSQIVTWVMGFFIFFDDYANSLTVGPVMRPVTDKMKISREKLAFIVDATAAPIAGMALISTWVAYELGVINDALNTLELGFGAYNMFLSSLPYRFYNIVILAFVFLSAYMLRDFGGMYKAEYRARTTGQLARPGTVPTHTDSLAPLNAEEEPVKSNIWYALVPILVLIIGAFVGFFVSGYSNVMNGDNEAAIAMLKESMFSINSIQTTLGESDASVALFRAAFMSSLVAIIMGVAGKKFKLSEGVETMITGIKSMNITAIILLLAWVLSGAIKELGTAIYLVHILSGSLPPFILPAVIFALGSVVSFSTGTSYGTMGILMPLAVPLAWSIMPEENYLVLCIGAVLTGAVFGDHCSPISDTSILSAMGASCDLMDHVSTQMVYALVMGALSTVLYLMAGLGMNVWLTLAIGLIATATILRVFGKKLPDTVAA